MHIEIVDYSENWRILYEKEALFIGNILKDEIISIFHIGSTSVRGLKAKPIIDIMPVVSDIEKIDALNPYFEAIGYEPMGEFGIERRRYFRKGKEKQAFHVHIFQYDNLYEIERHLAFRDYLRNFPDARQAYGSLKAELAKKYPNDIDAYCDGKDSLVKEIEARAMKWKLQNRN